MLAIVATLAAFSSQTSPVANGGLFYGTRTVRFSVASGLWITRITRPARDGAYMASQTSRFNALIGPHRCIAHGPSPGPPSQLIRRLSGPGPIALLVEWP